jgi:hypothetical protein
MRVILKRPRAADDLIELWDYVAENSVTRADGFIDDSTPNSIFWPNNPCSVAAGKNWLQVYGAFRSGGM